jgi:hypothetical protein
MQGLLYCHRETIKGVVKPDKMKTALSIFGIVFARPWQSRGVAGVRRDNAAEPTVAADRAVTGEPEVDLQHVVPDVPPAMRALDIVMAHPGPQDVIELRPAEADEEIEALALDRTDEGFRESIGIGRPVRDLDDPGGL